MSMDRVCPYCESRDLEADAEGTILRCRACERSSLPGGSAGAGSNDGVLAPDESNSSPDSHRARSLLFSKRLRDLRGAPGEVSSWPAAAASFAVTVVFYATLSMLPQSRFSELFVERGWVPYVITVISVWALFLLAAKLLRLRKERRMLDRDLVATNGRGEMMPDDAELALLTLHGEPKEIAESFLARRIERALRHFQSRRRAVEVVEFLSVEARTDEGRVDASYGLVRVFVWAIPTLGFIGTVIGIGAAVAGFSETLEAASSLDGMKESIGMVTGGLGVAFDTTLLALVMSILIMFPASAIQRIEEAFLSDVDDYCAEFLVPRLRDESTVEADEAVIAALADRLVASMQSGERR